MVIHFYYPSNDIIEHYEDTFRNHFVVSAIGENHDYS